MKHLTILVPEGEGNNLSSIVGSYKIFLRANANWKEKTGKTLFKVEVAGAATDYFEGLFSVQPHTNFTAIKKTNLIIIPSVNHLYQPAIDNNHALIEWVEQQYKKGAEVASICTGAFLLAAAGVLEGKTCSTNWAVADQFRKLYPGVSLQTDKLITDEDGVYTSGGAYSFLNLIIYLVEKYFDRQTAIYCAKIFQIEIDRQSQSPFMIFKGQKTHDDEIVKKAQLFIEKHIDEKISFKQLSNRFAVGRRNFDRRFIKATGNTPLEYAQRVKIESAKKSLETTRKTINEVMYEVGYSDVKAFREVFKKVTGISPLDYRKKYNKEALV